MMKQSNVTDTNPTQQQTATILTDVSEKKIMTELDIGFNDLHIKIRSKIADQGSHNLEIVNVK